LETRKGVFKKKERKRMQLFEFHYVRRSTNTRFRHKM